MAVYNFIINGTVDSGYTATCIAHGDRHWSRFSPKLIIVLEELSEHMNLHSNKLRNNLEPIR